MEILVRILFIGVLTKLTLDDLKAQAVYHVDLILLNALGLMLIYPRSIISWAMTLVLLSGLGLAVKQRLMGSGDLSVMCAFGLILSFYEQILLIQVACLVGLIWLLRSKKAAETLPFVPFLSLGFCVVYLIRLRLIFS